MTLNSLIWSIRKPRIIWNTEIGPLLVLTTPVLIRHKLPEMISLLYTEDLHIAPTDHETTGKDWLAMFELTVFEPKVETTDKLKTTTEIMEDSWSETRMQQFCRIIKSVLIPYCSIILHFFTDPDELGVGLTNDVTRLCGTKSSRMEENHAPCASRCILSYSMTIANSNRCMTVTHTLEPPGIRIRNVLTNFSNHWKRRRISKVCRMTKGWRKAHSECERYIRKHGNCRLGIDGEYSWR